MSLLCSIRFKQKSSSDLNFHTIKPANLKFSTQQTQSSPQYRKMAPSMPPTPICFKPYISFTPVGQVVCLSFFIVLLITASFWITNCCVYHRLRNQWRNTIDQITEGHNYDDPITITRRNLNEAATLEGFNCRFCYCDCYF